MRTYIGLAAQELGGGDDRARLVLLETISWLLNEGHLSHDWLSPNEGSVFVTRIGEGRLTLHP